MSATWSPLEPETVQSSSSAAIEERRDLAETLLELLLRDAELLRDLLVGRRAADPRLQLADRTLDLAGAGADGARHPVHRAKLVDDLALDPGHRVRLELHVARRVVALDRADQAEQAVGDEVALVHVGGEPGAEPARDVLHERRVREDQPVADLLVPGAPVVEPELLGLVGPRHDRENTAFPGGLLSVQCLRRRNALTESVASHAATARAATPMTSRRGLSPPASA